MSRASTPQAAADCEASLADCRETWCPALSVAGGEVDAQVTTCEQNCANQFRIGSAAQ